MAEGVSCKVVKVEPIMSGTRVILLPDISEDAIGQPIQSQAIPITVSKYQSESQLQIGYADPNNTINIETPLGCELEQYDELVASLKEPITILVSKRCSTCSLRCACPVYKPTENKSLKISIY